MDVLRFTVGALTVLGRPLDAPESGLFVRPPGIQGWDGLPAAHREAVRQAVGHGEYDTPVQLPARPVTVPGWILADTPWEMGRLRAQARAVGATGPVMLASEYQGMRLWARGRRVSAEAPDSGGRRASGLYVAEFEWQFVCPDPRQYGEAATFPESGVATSISVFHYGTFPAHPIIEIPSAPSNYTIISPGGTFTVAGATSGGTHRVDMRTGAVTRNGVRLSVGTGDLWAVPPGAVWRHTLSSAGRVLITDTFV